MGNEREAIVLRAMGLFERNGMPPKTEDDFAFLAVVDAYCWWLNHDFGFLVATKMIDLDGNRTGGGVGKYDLDIMRRIERAYSVSRNIPAHDAEVRRATVATPYRRSAAHRGRFGSEPDLDCGLVRRASFVVLPSDPSL